MKVRLTNLEYEELTKASKSSKCMSDYFRQRVFRKGVGLIDPKEFIRSMDEICLEMKRIGNNINQLARYVNIHKEEVNQEVLNEVEKKMADYVIMQDKLNVTWRHWRKTGKEFDTVLFRILPDMDDKRTLI